MKDHHLCKRWQKFSVLLLLCWIHQSLGPWQSTGVVSCYVSIGRVDGRLPFHQGGGLQVAERAQVQVSWVTGPEKWGWRKFMDICNTWIQLKWWWLSRWWAHSQGDNAGREKKNGLEPDFVVMFLLLIEIWNSSHLLHQSTEISGGPGVAGLWIGALEIWED